MSSTLSTSSSEAPAANHTANLLGALALALSDRTADVVSGAGGSVITDAVALSALHHFLDRTSIDVLAQVLGLTHSGAVRLVDRLAVAGLVTRAPGTDNRTTAVLLTLAGRGRARAVTKARAGVLEDALAVLSSQERHILDRLIGVVLAGLIREPGATRWVCRLCDTDACARPAGRCPVAQEARRRYG